MARVANTMRTIATRGMAYIEEQIHDANNKLGKVDTFDEDNPGHNFTSGNITSYKNSLKSTAKTDVMNAVKMFRFLFTTFNITTIPSAFTDTEVDAKDEDIRTHEE